MNLLVSFVEWLENRDKNLFESIMSETTWWTPSGQIKTVQDLFSTIQQLDRSGSDQSISLTNDLQEIVTAVQSFVNKYKVVPALVPYVPNNINYDSQNAAYRDMESIGNKVRELRHNIVKKCADKNDPKYQQILQVAKNINDNLLNIVSKAA